MAQDITLKIAGRDFHVKAQSENAESVMRFAAEKVSKMMDRYDEKYPDKPFEEKLLFATLTQAMYRVDAERRLSEISSEHDRLLAEIYDYLKDKEANR